MKTVLYSCPFVPAEWIAAHGLKPMRIIPELSAGRAPVFSGIGLCPYARGFIDCACSARAGAIVVTTTCDQMRRAAELIEANCKKPVFLLHVPTTWQTAAAQQYYRNELMRLGGFLEQLGGRKPTREQLWESIVYYGSTRAILEASRGYVSPRMYSEAIAHFHRTGRIHPRLKDSARKRRPRGPRVALVGGPLLTNHFDLFDVIQDAGGNVVFDATTTGERTFDKHCGLALLFRDLFEYLADSHYNLPDAFRRPNVALYEYLKWELTVRRVRGVIFHYYVWCDTWHAEAQRMKEWADVPVLVLESGDEHTINGHTASRIEAFMETLR